jgi:hypothetical protein
MASFMGFAQAAHRAIVFAHNFWRQPSKLLHQMSLAPLSLQLSYQGVFSPFSDHLVGPSSTVHQVSRARPSSNPFNAANN